MRLRLLALGFLLALLVGGFVWKAQSQPNDADVLLKLEADFQTTTAEKGWDGYVAYFAEDGVELPSGGSAMEGKQAIREALGQWGPDMSLTWTPVKAVMAASADLGYTYGTFVFKAKDKDGNPVTRHGKYTTIWKKQKDGTWKVALDMKASGPEPRTK